MGKFLNDSSRVWEFIILLLPAICFYGLGFVWLEIIYFVGAFAFSTAYLLIHVGWVARSYIRWILHTFLEFSSEDLTGNKLARNDYWGLLIANRFTIPKKHILLYPISSWFALFDKSHKHFLLLKQWGCILLTMALLFQQKWILSSAFFLTWGLTLCDPTGPLYQLSSVQRTLKQIGYFLAWSGWWLLILMLGCYPLIWCFFPELEIAVWISLIGIHGVLLIPVYYLGINTKAVREDSWLYLCLFNLSSILLVTVAWYNDLPHIMLMEMFNICIQLSCAGLESLFPDPRRKQPEE